MFNIINKYRKTMYIILIVAILGLSSCNKQEKLHIIIPTGTPTLSLAYALDNDNISKEIVQGSDPLLAAFSTNNYDIIVAPVNIGIRLYNTNKDNFNYILYHTIVWGNFYLASKEPLDSLTMLNNETILVYSKNSPCDIILRSIIKQLNLKINLEYVDDVATCNTYLITNKAKIIATAEPSLTKLKSTQEIYTLNLQDEWNKLSNGKDAPQAGIFVNKDKVNNSEVISFLEEVNKSIELITKEPLVITQKACKIDDNLAKIGEDLLTKALPNCHLQIVENEKAYLDYYIEQVIDLGLGKMIGEKIPDEDFYYQK